MNTLFDEDPIYNQQVRDSKGRFATREHALYDKAIVGTWKPPFRG